MSRVCKHSFEMVCESCAFFGVCNVVGIIGMQWWLDVWFFENLLGSFPQRCVFRASAGDVRLVLLNAMVVEFPFHLVRQLV